VNGEGSLEKLGLEKVAGGVLRLIRSEIVLESLRNRNFQEGPRYGKSQKSLGGGKTQGSSRNGKVPESMSLYTRSRCACLVR
jgi:hypothetical protein